MLPLRRIVVWLAPLLVGTVGLSVLDVAAVIGPGGQLTNGVVSLPAQLVYHGGLYAAWAALWALAALGLWRAR